MDTKNREFYSMLILVLLLRVLEEVIGKKLWKLVQKRKNSKF